MPEKIPKVKLGLKNLAMLPSYFDYIFVHLRQKVRLRPELSPKFLSTLDPNRARIRPEPEPDPKRPARFTTCPTYNSVPIANNKKGLRKFFARFLAYSNKISMLHKIVLSSSRGQGNFRGIEASRPRT